VEAARGIGAGQASDLRWIEATTRLGWGSKANHWFNWLFESGLFQSGPDLTTLLFPHGAGVAPSLGPA
jgi:hypothetical protein